MKGKTKFITHTAIIAATYVVLTFLASAIGLSSGVIQVRFSEAMSVLPIFTTAAIPGLCIGCFLSNLMTGCVFWDVIFGTIATLLGAIGTYYLRKVPYLASVPPILSNTIIVPFVLRYAYGAEGSLLFFMLTVGIGEIISCAGLGTLLYSALKKSKHIF